MSRSSPELAVDSETLDRVGETAFLRTLVENTSDGILTIDETSTIVSANPAIERIFGYAPADVVGTSLLTLIPPQLRERHTQSMERYLETGDRRLDWDYVELPGLHEEGHEVELGISFREHDENGQRLFTGVIRDITERKERERQLERYGKIVESVGDGIYQLDLDGRFVAVNDVVVEVTGYSRDELLGESVRTILDDDDVTKSLETVRQLIADDETSVGVVELEVQTADGNTVPVENRIALLRSGGELQGSVGLVRDITDRKHREKELERQRNDLAQLDRLNSVIREINQALVTASTRDEIERTVCERLAESESYVFAWIGEHHPGGRTIEPTSWAGIDGSYLDDVTITADQSARGKGPTGRAVRTGSVQVVQDISEDPAFEPWRDEALDRGFRSSAAIPIVYRDTLYGVLNLYSDRKHGFTDREIEVLDELGGTIGLAFHDVENERLLHSDTAIELEFNLTDPNSFFTDASRQLGCTFTLDGLVPAEENVLLYYVTASGVDPDSVLALVTAEENIQDARVLSGSDGEFSMVVEVTGSSAVKALIDAGASIGTAVADSGESTLVVHVAPDTDTGTVVDTVRRRFPESSLVGKRKVERPVQTSRQFRETVKDRLTDKQRQALEAAFLGGYFGQQRTIDGSELAESFDVAPSTFHHHLQTGLEKVLGAVFAGSESA